MPASRCREQSGESIEDLKLKYKNSLLTRRVVGEDINIRLSLTPNLRRVHVADDDERHVVRAVPGVVEGAQPGNAQERRADEFAVLHLHGVLQHRRLAVGADVLECSNHPGPYLNIGAGTDGPGLATTILATNNKNKAQAWIDAQGPVNGFHYADADGYVTLEPTGGAIRVRKGGPLQATSYNDNPWGPGGNPHIWVFPTEDLNGTMPTLTIGGDGYMARCHDL